MSSTRDSQRIDTLLALALIFGERSEAEDGGVDDGEISANEGGAPAGVLRLLSGLGVPERMAVERRAEWFARLPPVKQREWLTHVLGRARIPEKAARLDEHVHPSHVVEALRDEPSHIQRVVINHLPPGLRAQAAQALGVAQTAGDGETPGAGPGQDEGSHDARATQTATDGNGSLTPAPEVVEIVRRTFLSLFTSFGHIMRPTPLDQLSGVELARLVRLLGVRETAVACRGIVAKEAVASFLRRFAPEDARAIASNIATLTTLSPRRVAFAAEVVREALGVEPEPGAMLDLIGLRLLAATLSGHDETRLRYAAQKFPLEVARLLRVLATQAQTSLLTEAGDTAMRETIKLIARETEAIAAGMRKGANLAPRRRSGRMRPEKT